MSALCGLSHTVSVHAGFTARATPRRRPGARLGQGRVRNSGLSKTTSVLECREHTKSKSSNA